MQILLICIIAFGFGVIVGGVILAVGFLYLILKNVYVIQKQLMESKEEMKR